VTGLIRDKLDKTGQNASYLTFFGTTGQRDINKWKYGHPILGNNTILNAFEIGFEAFFKVNHFTTL